MVQQPVRILWYHPIADLLVLGSTCGVLLLAFLRRPTWPSSEIGTGSASRLVAARKKKTIQTAGMVSEAWRLGSRLTHTRFAEWKKEQGVSNSVKASRKEKINIASAAQSKNVWILLMGS